MPELKYSEETFRDMYEALKTISAFYSETGYKNEMPSMIEAVRKINRALAKTEGK